MVALIKNTTRNVRQLRKMIFYSWRNRWRTGDAKVLDPVLYNAFSKSLKAAVESPDSGFSEIIIMRKRGLAIGASPKTSDYWQGDESKRQKTNTKGLIGFHAGRYELDKSTNQRGIQTSRTLVLNNAATGALTVGVNIAHRGKQ